MKNAFRAGVEFYKKEGIGKFIIRIVKWVPEYIIWRRYWLRSYLFDHVARYRGRIKFGRLQRELNLDAFTEFKTIMGGLEYCKVNSQEYRILNEGEKIEVALAKSFEERSKVQRTIFDSPPIYLTVFTDIDVYGDTNLLSKGRIALSDMCYRDKGIGRYDVEGGCIVSCHRKGKWFQVAYKKTDIVVEEAINCVGWACKNYFHFTFEILSRLPFIDEYEEYRAMPVLVDAGALQIPQMKDLFDRVNIYKHPIIFVGQNAKIRVKKLVYVSRNLWMPPNFKSGTITTAKDYLFSRSTVDNIRNRILSDERYHRDSSYNKIYLSRRKCGNQRLMNAGEIEKIFAEHGFQIVFPEDWSFEEEVAVFHDADVIVGATGAAFTNMAFCHEGAKVGIIIPSANDSYFFSNIANMVNVEFIILGADIVKKEKFYSLDTFVLNPDKCRRFIQYIEA